jgi:hypothetical protein
VSRSSPRLATGRGKIRVALTSSAALALALTTFTAPARAKSPKRATRAELAEAGLDDPRSRQWPRRHRLRLTIHADWVRLSSACGSNGKCTRFHYAPMMLDFGYQLQFLRMFMLRPSLALGGNVANSRNAMPAMVKPAFKLGFQHKLFGVAAGYSYTQPFPTQVDAVDAFGGPVQPVIQKQHAFDGEFSFTSRIERTALTFALTISALNAQLVHADIDRYRWFARLGFAAGFMFDVGKKKKKRRRKR